MKRYRFTLLAICLVLAWLGYHDITLFLRNQKPMPVSIADLETNGAPQEWLEIEGGFLDLEQAINPSGQLETLESGPWYVPIVSQKDFTQIHVVVETWRPEIIEIQKKYYIGFDTAKEQKAFLENNRDKFHPQLSITGMTASWLTSTANRDKLLQLAKELQMPVSPDVIFVSEGKEPGKFRGFFFAVIAIFGILKFIQMTIKKESGLAAELPNDED
jgi:hypothetical protein